MTHRIVVTALAVFAAKEPGTNPFIEPNACRAYAEAASKSLDRRIAEER